MDEEIKYLSGGTELLDRISPLWEKLKKHHVSRSLHFSKDLNSKSFEWRKKGLISKSRYLRADIAYNIKEEQDAGYCIATIDNNSRGEIDSLFIDTAYRRQGIGKKLTEEALSWLNNNGAVENSIYVASGNEEVLGFYESFGFLPRGIHLVQKI